VLITVDIGRIQEALDLGIAQPVKSEELQKNIPASSAIRGPLARALPARPRVYVSKSA
jgi:iron(III) transport system substrate-binding protein